MKDHLKSALSAFGAPIIPIDMNDLYTYRERRAFPECAKINMKDYAESAPTELAEVITNVARNNKAVRIVVSPASVPTQKLYVGKVREALGYVPVADIPALKAKVSVDDGPFVASARRIKDDIFKDW